MLRLGGEAGGDEAPILSDCRRAFCQYWGDFWVSESEGFGGLCDFLALSGWDGMGWDDMICYLMEMNILIV